MLMFDSHWMPRAMPETADATKAAVMIAMIPTRRSFVGSWTQPTLSRPEPICSAPRPSDATVPNSVAKMARMSMTLPAGPVDTFGPNRRSNTELISCVRPSRNVLYASANPTTAYIAQGWNPQWNIVVAIAARTSSAAISGGGLTKWKSGS